ncbi:flavodoxin-dependent (E)-4-hydroxy-3-methylbut-2-enyl-diphosphate synthase [bacterium]|nr:flavodoxin-dependent (E)-4-hydroxy-3-methylbut-2-enyl-diphosphate synthase [bacterium]
MKKIKRKKTKIIKIGNIEVGGNNPVAIQSMTNTPTKNIKKTIEQIKKLEKAGCEIIRVAVPDIASSQVLRKIKKSINIPLVADIHFSAKIAIESINQGVDKLRINPGNFPEKELGQIIKLSKRKKIPIRVGVNAGSLDQKILKKYGSPNAQAMVESAMKSIKKMENHNFKNLVIALKASDINRTIDAYEILSKKVDYPLHLGITEAGTEFSGTIKSSIGLGYLLLNGIGDTIRISLSADPVKEVRVAWEILKALDLRNRGIKMVSCPTCARATINVTKLAPQVEKMTENIKKPLKIAVMGCIVNGPGEAGEVDLAVVGAGKKAMIITKGDKKRLIEKKDILKEFKKEIDKIK